MSVLEQLNGGGVYLICGSIVAFIAVVCVIFMVRAWRAGKALGMDVTRMKRAVTASATFSVLPSVGILCIMRPRWRTRRRNSWAFPWDPGR